ncbi:MAG: 6-carboxytetrahydropterin synthase [Betaproteobacteria bacterium]
MKYELSQRFFFEAAHTLSREVDAAGSRRIHGHTYHAEVSVRGDRNPSTGMVIDLAILRKRIEMIREQLDHHLLNDVLGNEAPTLENLTKFIAENMKEIDPPISSVRVWRETTGDSCVLNLEEGDQ